MFLQENIKQNSVALLQQQQRLQIEDLINSTTLSETNSKDDSKHNSDVIQGLTQKSKSISMHYRYDNRGSKLFEKICDLPEYYLTRTETAILQECAVEIARITGPCEIVELGSGNAVKTRILLDAYNQLSSSLRYLPIDISAGILKSSAVDLLNDYPSLQVHGFASTFELALEKLAPSCLPSRMISFIGSTLGGLNLGESDALISQVFKALQSGEYFLLGIDLHKEKHLLEAAYNDKQGVNAEFNFNILNHLNEKFSGNFNRTKFDHAVTYNESLHQIEIYLKSRQKQNVQLRDIDLNIEIEDGELIVTGIARKFELSSTQEKLKSFGLETLKFWTDTNQWYALLLCQKN
jgi:L-histidine Nalpha-methyltransferase